MIYVGIDDTDKADAPGTNRLARSLIRDLASDYRSLMAVRHQLLVDSRVPYTRQNSSASILFLPHNAGAVDPLIERLRHGMRRRFVDGSDPGLCVARRVPPEVIEFGRRCQREVVEQQEARELARAGRIHLEGLGGSGGGVIGALAAVGVVAGGSDGRVVSIRGQPDELAGPQDVATLLAWGVDEIRCHESGEPVRRGTIDVGKHLRPNYRGGKIVLFVANPRGRWQAVRLP